MPKRRAAKESSDESTCSPRGKSTIRTVCEECRTRKKRCVWSTTGDGETPICRFCARWKLECTFQPKLKPGPVAKHACTSSDSEADLISTQGLESDGSASLPWRSNSDEIVASPALIWSETQVTRPPYGFFPVLPTPLVIPMMTAAPAACFETNFSNLGCATSATSCISPFSPTITPFLLADAAAHMLQLAMTAEQLRLFAPGPCRDRPERMLLEHNLNQCLMAAPFGRSTSTSDKLLAIKKELVESASPIPLDTQHAALLALAYHSAFCILFSPPDDHIWTKCLDERWIKSDSFVEANDHAIRATQILIPLLDAPELPDIVRFVEFQWCILRTGLLHQAFLYAAEKAGEDGHLLAAEAKTHIALHSKALLRAHEANGLAGAPWWTDEWPAEKDYRDTDSGASNGATTT